MDSDQKQRDTINSFVSIWLRVSNCHAVVRLLRMRRPRARVRLPRGRLPIAHAHTPLHVPCMPHSTWDLALAAINHCLVLPQNLLSMPFLVSSELLWFPLCFSWQLANCFNNHVHFAFLACLAHNKEWNTLVKDWYEVHNYCCYYY